MRPIIIAKKFTLTDDVKERVQKKLNKLDRFFPAETEATVMLREERGKVKVEITVYRNGSIFRAEEVDKEAIFAIDHAVDVIERQIRKNRTRLEKKLYIDKAESFAQADAEDTDAEETLNVYRVKQFDFPPMSTEEAMMQMNLLAHNFFMFRNAETGMFNLVYKRDDNKYGVIVPKE